MFAIALRRLGIAALALWILPLPALAQGLPTGKRQHKPVSAASETATDPDELGRIKTKQPWLPAQPVEPQPTSDRSYRLDPDAGEIRFGDGARGRRPPGGEPAPRPRGAPPKQAPAASHQHNQSDLEFPRRRASEGDGEADAAPGKKR